MQSYQPDPASAWERGVGLLRGTAVAAVLVSTLMVTNLCQVSSVVLRPFSLRAFRRVNRACAQCWWGLCVMCSRYVNGVRMIFTGDDVPRRENAIVVANHQQMPDIVALMCFGWDKGRLGDMKYFIKASLRHVPGMGWGLSFLDALFLQRNWEADRGAIENTFGKFVRERIPVWIVSFVEGTRITPSKQARSVEYAQRHDLPALDAVLLPRTKGFVAAVNALRGHVTAVYDVTIAYPGGIPTLWQYLKGWVSEVHVHVRRVPVADLPTDAEALGNRLVIWFQEKDVLLKGFQRSGAFPSAVTVGGILG